MKQALELPFQIEGIMYIDDTPAHRALREALANCLTNANYRERREVVCLWEEDALRISNPGDFRPALVHDGGDALRPHERLAALKRLRGVGRRSFAWAL